MSKARAQGWMGSDGEAERARVVPTEQRLVQFAQKRGASPVLKSRHEGTPRSIYDGGRALFATSQSTQCSMQQRTLGGHRLEQDSRP